MLVENSVTYCRTWKVKWKGRWKIESFSSQFLFWGVWVIWNCTNGYFSEFRVVKKKNHLGFKKKKLRISPSCGQRISWAKPNSVPWDYCDYTNVYDTLKFLFPYLPMFLLAAGQYAFYLLSLLFYLLYHMKQSQTIQIVFIWRFFYSI